MRQMRQSTSNPCKYWLCDCLTFFLKMRQMRQAIFQKPANPCKHWIFNNQNLSHFFEKVRQKNETCLIYSKTVSTFQKKVRQMRQALKPLIL